MSGPDAALEAEEAERSGNRLHFRVLSIGGARKAFRLEMIYWRAIEVMAERNGRSVAAEVEARLGKAAEHPNQSSLLRANLTSDLFEAWREAEAQLARPDWSAMVAALPTPAFLASRRSVLLAVNEPLLAMLQSLRSEPGTPFDTLQGAADLRVQVPDSVAAELRAGAERKFVVCNVTFTGQSQRIVCRARMIAAQGASPRSANLLGLLGG